MIQAALLLGCILLSSVTAFPWKTQNGGLPAVTETEPTSDVLSNKIPPPTPSTCQNLLYMLPPITPLLSDYLLALGVVLEKIGCPAEAFSLQLQHTKTGGKAGTETLILESQKHSQEEGTGNDEVILRHLVPSPGEMKRVQRSVTLPEECTSDPGWLLSEMAQLMIESVEKFPSTDLVRELKASAVNVTQQCTMESWEHLYEVAKRLMNNPELKEVEIPIEHRVYMAGRLAVLVNRLFLKIVWNSFQNYFG